ncbi:MAG: HesA/MoeB/ThiF family protein [Candidatus Gastranaerophilales bacterium]|nr:HesA/MoeB/ThiF family protein [Candidatus Gastranaerophilales bacterium]
MKKFTRYQRNLEIGGITKEQQEQLLNSKVLVMGVGGLGSGVIMNLAALGVGQIKIVANEIVEETNFNRQLIHKHENIGRAKVMSAKEWVQEFNSDVKVEIDKTKIDELNYFNVIDDYDIIVDCFDNYESKYILNEIAHRHKKILVHASTQGYCGQITTIVPGQTGCLSCLLQKPEKFEEEPVCSLSPVVNVIAALQAQEVLKILTGNGELLLNKLLAYDGYKGAFKTLNFSKNPHCEVCNPKEEDIFPFEDDEETIVTF